MADPSKRLELNTEGSFYVDSSCINCDTCRQLAPDNFAEEDGYSYVYNQPTGNEAIKSSMRAVIACPTGSIGHDPSLNRRDFLEEFPLLLDDGLYYCGFHSPKSFGGASYLIQHQGTTIMVDSPRYATRLIEGIEQIGGIDYIFLTHRDDVADADKYAKQFNAERIIHYHDKSAQPDAERLITGHEDQELVPGVTIIPTPGHTKGHLCLLVDNKYLFTGDHLYWRRDWEGLRASRRMNWYSWTKQKSSLHKLAKYSFKWVLPGHGQRIHLPPDKMKQKLDELLEKIDKPNYW